MSGLLLYSVKCDKRYLVQIRRYIFPYDGKNTKFVLAENHEAKVAALEAQIKRLTEKIKELRLK